MMVFASKFVPPGDKDFPTRLCSPSWEDSSPENFRNKHRQSLTNWGRSMRPSLEWRLGSVPSEYLNRRETASGWKIGIANTCGKSKALPCSCTPGCGAWRGGSLGLSGFQPRPCEEGIRQRGPEQDSWHLVSVYACEHMHHTQTYSQKI